MGSLWGDGGASQGATALGNGLIDAQWLTAPVAGADDDAEVAGVAAGRWDTPGRVGPLFGAGAQAPATAATNSSDAERRTGGI